MKRLNYIVLFLLIVSACIAQKNADSKFIAKKKIKEIKAVNLLIKPTYEHGIYYNDSVFVSLHYDKKGRLIEYKDSSKRFLNQKLLGTNIFNQQFDSLCNRSLGVSSFSQTLSISKYGGLDTSNALIKYPSEWVVKYGYGELFLKYKCAKDLPTYKKNFYKENEDNSIWILSFNPEMLKGKFIATYSNSWITTSGNFKLSNIYIDSTKKDSCFLYRYFLHDSIWTQPGQVEKTILKTTYRNNNIVRIGTYDYENNLLLGGLLENGIPNGEWVDYIELKNDHDAYIKEYFLNEKIIYFQWGTLSTNKIKFERFLEADKEAIGLEGTNEIICFWYQKNYDEKGQIKSEGYYVYTIVESDPGREPRFDYVPYGKHKVYDKNGKTHEIKYPPFSKKIKYTVPYYDYDEGIEKDRNYEKKIR